MKEQLKACAYVRKQRPALMETNRVGITAMYNYEINLQDWLAVLEDEIADILVFDGVAKVQVGEEYTEKGKVLSRIFFNLTTGQPATEADYKAFNDIVNV